VKLKNPERNAYHFVMFTKGYRKMAGLFSLLTAGGMSFHSQQSILEKGGFDRPARKEEGDRKKLFSNHEK